MKWEPRPQAALLHPVVGTTPPSLLTVKGLSAPHRRNRQAGGNRFLLCSGTRRRCSSPDDRPLRPDSRSRRHPAAPGPLRAHADCDVVSFNTKNVVELAGWLDDKQVGTLTLLASHFHRENSPADWQAAVNELRSKRRVRLAAARNHAKVVTMDWPDGRTLAMEGSANLRTNSNQEQLTLVNDPALSAWHGAWIDLLVEAAMNADEPST